MNPSLPAEEIVREYPRPPRIEAVDWPLRVEQDGAVLAETRNGLRVLETWHPPCYYFPAQDVDFGRLVPSNLSTFCEWKGRARYWHLQSRTGLIENACWAYPMPSDPRLAGRMSFYAGRVEACFVAGERVTPQEGDFYGGWISSWVRGPFKGGPGTAGW